VLVGVLVGVAVGGTGVLVGVLVGVAVGGTGVLVGVLVGVAVGGTGVLVGVLVGVAVGTGVFVGVGVGVASCLLVKVQVTFSPALRNMVTWSEPNWISLPPLQVIPVMTQPAGTGDSKMLYDDTGRSLNVLLLGLTPLSLRLKSPKSTEVNEKSCSLSGMASLTIVIVPVVVWAAGRSAPPRFEDAPAAAATGAAWAGRYECAAHSPLASSAQTMSQTILDDLRRVVCGDIKTPSSMIELWLACLSLSWAQPFPR